MLLKIEKTILRAVNKKGNQESIEVSELNKYSNNDYYDAFKSLKDKGYFESVDASIDYSCFSYVLTAKGRFYKEYKRKKFITNIVIPFLVALLTTIATLYLENLVEDNHSTYTSEYTYDYSGKEP